MSVSDEFSTYILELLEPLGSIQTTRMFGGVLLKVNGKQLGILIEETVYFKVTDRVLQKRYTEEGSKQFTYTRILEKTNKILLLYRIGGVFLRVH